MIKNLALNLDSTLISDSISLHPRPGLYDFLSWALKSYDKVVWMTDIPKQRVEHAIRMMIQFEAIPEEAAEIGFAKKCNDLDCVGGDEALLVTHNKEQLQPHQSPHLVSVVPWDGNEDDLELERVRNVLTMVKVREQQGSKVI